MSVAMQAPEHTPAPAQATPPPPSCPNARPLTPRVTKQGAHTSTREGARCVRMPMKAQSGIFGTALRLTKVTSVLVFPKFEADHAHEDSGRADVTLIDPTGGI